MKIILWGTGYIYNQIKNSLAYFELTNQIEILGVTASKVQKASTIDGYTVYTHEDIKALDFDYIVIMTEQYFNDIKRTIIELGISNEKILSYKMFLIPDVNLEEYVSIKKERLTIISNNCWGGMAYSSLGLECISPTKNLFFTDRDYIKLIKDIKKYMRATPIYLRNDVDVNSKKIYPVLGLDDIEIHCNHSESAETAIQDWNRRAKKMNLDNLFVEMYTKDEAIANEFLSITKEKCKLCLVPFDMENECAIKIDLNSVPLKPWDIVLATASMNNEVFRYDLIKLLRGQKILRIK